jgi:hypothetical protein
MKKVVWGEGKYSSATRPGHYRSLAEAMEKGERLRAEQEKAQSYLVKALPAMLKLLEIRMTNGEPLTVMRPLRYSTSCLKSEMEDDLDKSFYNTDKNVAQGQDKFIDVVKTINPGTQIMLKALDPNLREFVFKDGMGKEHAISYDERNSILTQTDIFETVQKLFESKGER